MQVYDLVMLAVMGGAIFFGFWKGFAWQVASLASIFASYFVARNFYEPVANMIGGDPSWNRFLAMFILFMGTSLLIWLGFGFVKGSIEKMHLRGFDRQVGAVLGAGKGVLLCTLITLFGVSLLGENACRSICASKSGNYIARLLGHAGGLVPEEIGKYINPHINKFRTEMDAHKDDLPQDNFQQRPEFQPQPGDGTFQPTLQNPWANPNMTNSGGAANEQYGQLQRVPGGSQNQQQPVYNGTTGRWEYPSQTQTQPTQANGQFQVPNVTVPNVTLPASWQQTAKDVAREAAEAAAQEAWKRTFGEDQN